MTHSIRKLCSALLLAGCFSYSNAQTVAELDPNQTYSTGNIVVPTTTESGSTWTNGVYQDSLTCWAWGYPGYCGPNAIVRPDGNINFSFGFTDLYQSQAIANVLPNSGTGLRVNGYNFSFTAKNGNGWDNGGLDYLEAYVHFTDKNGSVVEYDRYNLTFNYDWTNFNLSRNFTSPYSAGTLGNVTYGLLGQDWNGWAGPYGPEVNNISFSLRYSVDPCAVSVLSSPSCEGYLEYIASLSSTPAVETAASPVISTSETAATSDTVAAVPATQQTAAASEQTNSTGSVSAAPQTTVAESDRSSDKKSGPSLSQIQSIVGGELNRINQLESKTVSETTAQAQAASDSSAAQAESVAGAAQNQSIAGSIEQGQSSATASVNQSQSSTQASQSSTSASLQNNRQQSHMSAQQQIETTVVESQTSMPNQTPTAQTSQPLFEQQTQAEVYQQPETIGLENSANTGIVAGDVQSNPIYSLVPPAAAVIEVEPVKEDTKPSVLSHTPRAEDAAERVSAMEETTPSTGPTVRRGGAVDGMSGGDIAALAAAPVGFDSYLTQQMVDAQFYASRDIYRGQVNVDNARALRQLGTDRLHQEMVDQQYNIGAK